MDQQHALAREPNAAIAGREMEQAAQVGVGWHRGWRRSGHFLDYRDICLDGMKRDCASSSSNHQLPTSAADEMRMLHRKKPAVPPLRLSLHPG
jgi:hypothetical protein